MLTEAQSLRVYTDLDEEEVDASDEIAKRFIVDDALLRELAQKAIDLVVETNLRHSFANRDLKQIRLSG